MFYKKSVHHTKVNALGSVLQEKLAFTQQMLPKLKSFIEASNFDALETVISSANQLEIEAPNPLRSGLFSLTGQKAA